jgi:purine-nucleoside phosphorylase
MKSPVGLILGSGWGKIVSTLADKKEVTFERVFKQKTTVPGHQGKVVTGKIHNNKVIILSHTYEGHTPTDAAKTVRFLHKEGVKKVIITSASGGLNPKYRVGDLVILKDLITLFSQSPLQGPNFQDLSRPFSEALQGLAVDSAKKNKIRFQKGVYAYVRGPHFETFSDKKALRILGADVVGMSTVPEVILANNLGMEVLGLSLVTNLAFVKHNHKEVLAAAQSQEEKLYKFINTLISSI